jgi:hypothetical protein
LRNPLYAITGTGPGLISLPASEHVPSGVYKIVFPIIDSPPAHGILLELANTGIVGVTTWIFQVASIFFLGRRLRGRRGLPFPPEAVTRIFLAAAALYSVQVSPSPFWAVFLGLGWAIAHVASVRTGVTVPRLTRPHEIPALAGADGRRLVVESTLAFASEEIRPGTTAMLTSRGAELKPCELHSCRSSRRASCRASSCRIAFPASRLRRIRMSSIWSYQQGARSGPRRDRVLAQCR